MKNTKTFEGRLIHYTRRQNSINGNPKYCGVFMSDEGEILEGTTATDASCGYDFLNFQEQKRVVTYHVTKKGNIIIDRINVLK